SLPTFISLRFFNAPAPTGLYALSLHDALPICRTCEPRRHGARLRLVHAQPGPRGSQHPRTSPPVPEIRRPRQQPRFLRIRPARRSEEHTSELQSRENLVCRLLLEKKKEYTQLE